MRLLEVVADDLVRGFVPLLEPGAEALVQLRPSPSSSPRRQRRGPGRDGSGRCRRRRHGAHVPGRGGRVPLAASQCPRAPPARIVRGAPPREKSRPATAARSVSARSAASRRESAGEAPRRPTQLDRAPGPASSSGRLLEEERVPSGNPDDLGPCLLVDDALLQPHRARPPARRPAAPRRGLRPSSPIQAGLSTSSRRARQSTRSAASAGHESEILDEVEQRGLGPVDVLEEDDDWPLPAPAPRGSAARPRTPHRSRRHRSPVP